ncbi:MAG TPA: CHASE4 domain-containing protein, partial [Myxococcota bacterium]|nr:CHASE4 domain-containing protein [Myxococcota bacterium]
MSLAQKTALIVVLYAIANVAIGYSIHRNVVAPEFADLEQREVAKNMQRAFEAIQREAAFLDVLAHDVASWDATYEFAETHDREFYALNLSPAALKTSALDWAIAVDAAGELISGPIRDIRTGEKLAIDELSARSWSRAH